ncbi:MAG: SDR family oxidoreductase [Sphingobacteriales bacterium]|nr:SDR family oxidoreductase [Sphingobacteriales bacterium]
MNKPKILVTGASKGIGLAIANQLKSNFQILAHASSLESLHPFGDDVELIAADLSDPIQLQNFCKELKSKHSEDLVAVINNAGLTFDKPIIFQSEKDIDLMMAVNLKAPIMISKTAMKIFSVKGKGTIINISSCVAQTGNAFQAVYSATKAGLIAFSKSLAKESGAINSDNQIRVLSVAPGLIETAMTNRIPEKEMQKYLEFVPAHRLGKAEEMAALVEFLLSDKAAYINGSCIDMNGGMF